MRTPGDIASGNEAHLETHDAQRLVRICGQPWPNPKATLDRSGIEVSVCSMRMRSRAKISKSNLPTPTLPCIQPSRPVYSPRCRYIYCLPWTATRAEVLIKDTSRVSSHSSIPMLLLERLATNTAEPSRSTSRRDEAGQRNIQDGSQSCGRGTRLLAFCGFRLSSFCRMATRYVRRDKPI